MAGVGGCSEGEAGVGGHSEVVAGVGGHSEVVAGVGGELGALMLCSLRLFCTEEVHSTLCMWEGEGGRGVNGVCTAHTMM